MKPISAEIRENKEIAPGIFRLRLQSSAPVEEPTPGRFFMLRLTASCDPLLRRPLGLLDLLPGEDGLPLLDFLYQVRGRGTYFLSQQKPPARLNYLGPLGRGWQLESPRPRIVMIAGGIGIVPLVAAARFLRRRGSAPEIEFFFGARSAAGLVLGDELKELGVRLILAAEDGSAGFAGQITQALEKDWLSRPPTADVLLLTCGPRAMLKKVAALARERNLPCQASLEARMACGLGACLSCSIKGADGKNLRVCQEGPVVDAAAVDWEALDESP